MLEIFRIKERTAFYRGVTRKSFRPKVEAAKSSLIKVRGKFMIISENEY